MSNTIYVKTHYVPERYKEEIMLGKVYKVEESEDISEIFILKTEKNDIWEIYTPCCSFLDEKPWIIVDSAEYVEYKQDRLVVAKDRKTAILDKTIHLKAINTPDDAVCKGCYFRQEDHRCRVFMDNLAEGGARCATPDILWVEDIIADSTETEKTKEYSEIEDFLSLVYRVLTTCGPEEAEALLLQVSEKGFNYDKDLYGCFSFDSTKQGYDYWYTISKRLGEM